MSQEYACPHCSNVIHPGYGYQPETAIQCMNCGQQSLPPASPGGLTPLDQYPPQQPHSPLDQFPPQEQYTPQDQFPPQQQYAPQQHSYAPQHPQPSYGGQPQQNYSTAAAAGSTFLGRLGTRLLIRVAIGVCALIVFGVGSIGLVVCGGIMSLFSGDGIEVAKSSPTPTSTPTGGHATETLVGAPIASPGASIFGPSVPFGQERVTETSDNALKYNWKGSKERFRANVEFELKLGSRTLDWSGNTVYTPTSKTPGASASSAGLPGEFGDRDRQGNGTGFVVRPDGYIATCAHVVEDANEIVAVINGNEYPAKVIAVDNDADLAIVRINANSLPHLPILDSASVRLAEDVRVFGYPLADRLGESIKITRGTVSGITGDDTAKVFQLDVTVNPGNSGGPLVNDRGQVAGVVTSLLSGARISEVSFAAGPGSLRKLMDKAGLRYEQASGGTVLPGPELAAKVTRSVALLKVKAGGSSAGSAEHVVLDYKSFWSKHVLENGNMALGSADFRRENGSIIVGLDGEIASSNCEFSVLRSLGMASLVALEQLPSGKQESWQVTEMVVIPETESKTVQNAPSPSPYGRRRPPFLPWDRRSRPATTTSSTTKLHPSVQVRHYEILKTEGDLVHIKKLVKLSTFDPDDRGKTPYMRVDGEGVFKFNKAKRLPDSLDFSGTIYVNKSEGLLAIPFKITYKIDGEQAIAASEAETKRRVAESQAKAKKLEEERKANATPVVKGLDKLDLAP